MSTPENHTYHLLQLAAHSLKKSSDNMLVNASRVTTAQAAVLTLVASGDGVTQNEMARRLGINESAITSMIAKLLDRRLVSRSRSKTDARARQIRITAKGKRALAKADVQFRKINSSLERIIGKSDVTEINRKLAAIAKGFHESS